MHCRPPDEQKRRVQLRGGSAGAAQWPAVDGQAPPGPREEPSGVGPPVPEARDQGQPHRGRQPGGAVLHQSGPQSGRRRLQVPQPQPQGTAHHEGRRRRPRVPPPARGRRHRRHLRVHSAPGGEKSRR